MAEESDKTVRRVRLALANVGCIVWVLGLLLSPGWLPAWLVLGALLIAAAFAAPDRWLRRLALFRRGPRP